MGLPFAVRQTQLDMCSETIRVLMHWGQTTVWATAESSLMNSALTWLHEIGHRKTCLHRLQPDRLSAQAGYGQLKRESTHACDVITG